MTPRVFVLTSNSYLWAMWGFAYMFQTYWDENQEVVVGCFARPGYQLPQNYIIHSIAKNNYPPDRWSDAMIALMKAFPNDDYFILMLEDYWLTRKVDTSGIEKLADYMRSDPSILRFDLTEDRMHAGEAFPVGYCDHFDILETPSETPYQMSLQAAIWNRTLLLSLLESNKSAWQVEIQTKPPSTMRVLGTRQCPVRYANVMYKGKLDYGELDKIPAEHRETIMISIPPKIRNENAQPITNPG